jgi:hypothetical protein
MILYEKSRSFALVMWGPRLLTGISGIHGFRGLESDIVLNLARSSPTPIRRRMLKLLAGLALESRSTYKSG